MIVSPIFPINILRKILKLCSSKSSTIIEKTETISKEFYNKFSKICDSLELQEFPSDSYEESINKIQNIVSKFKTLKVL